MRRWVLLRDSQCPSPWGWACAPDRAWGWRLEDCRCNLWRAHETYWNWQAWFVLQMDILSNTDVKNMLRPLISLKRRGRGLSQEPGVLSCTACSAFTAVRPWPAAPSHGTLRPYLYRWEGWGWPETPEFLLASLSSGINNLVSSIYWHWMAFTFKGIILKV